MANDDDDAIRTGRRNSPTVLSKNPGVGGDGGGANVQ